MHRHFGLWRMALIGLMAVAFLAAGVPAMADQCCPQADKVDCKKDCSTDCKKDCPADCKKDCKKDCKPGDKCDKTRCCPSSTSDAGIKSSSATAKTTGAVAKAGIKSVGCSPQSCGGCSQGSGKSGTTGVTAKPAPQQEKAKKSKTI